MDIFFFPPTKGEKNLVKILGLQRTVLTLVKFFNPKKFYFKSRRIKSFQVVSDQLVFFPHKRRKNLVKILGLQRTVLTLVKFFNPKKFYFKSRRIKSFQVVSDQLVFFPHKRRKNLNFFQNRSLQSRFRGVDGRCSGGGTTPGRRDGRRVQQLI